MRTGMMNGIIALRLRPEFVELQVNDEFGQPIGLDAIDAPDMLCAGGMRTCTSEYLGPFPFQLLFYRPEQ